MVINFVSSFYYNVLFIYELSKRVKHIRSERDNKLDYAITGVTSILVNNILSNLYALSQFIMLLI